ncbi:MAG: FliA/WhiG family RNA polymerase sigma factor [Cellulosilyticaceae bacterium]
MTEHMIEGIWKRYKESRDFEAKQELIVHYAYLVKLVAGRVNIYLNNYVELDDLIGYGVIGLIDAVDKFSLDKNVKFDTYASLRIRGAILDEIRKLDWIPRSLRKKQKELNKAISDLGMTLGRPPEDKEIANYLKITIDDYYELIQQTNISNLLFIDDCGTQIANLEDTQVEKPEYYVEKQEILEDLTVAMEGLPERERMVVTLYYFEEMTLKEISSILEVSESRVSQLHTKAVSRLRMTLGKYHKVLPL